jgi:hypothetical protein
MAEQVQATHQGGDNKDEQTVSHVGDDAVSAQCPQWVESRHSLIGDKSIPDARCGTGDRIEVPRFGAKSSSALLRPAKDRAMHASASDVGFALLAFLGTAVPMLGALYIGTRMADRGVDARLCWVVAFAVLLGGWGVLLLPTLSVEKAACTHTTCLSGEANSGD